MSEKESRVERARRELVLRALAAGVLGTAPLGALRAQPLGKVPGPLPAGRSIYELRGPVMVNGQPATLTTAIGSGAVVETGAGATVSFVVGADAFLLRERSRMQMSGTTSTLVSLLRLTTGALLSVFGSGRKRVETGTATIGIRGTGLYLEAEPERSYVCVCYGATDVATADDPAVQEAIVSTHHDAPRYVLGPKEKRRIIPAPFVNHSDLELMLLENLVGRTTPFSLFDESYGSQRRY
jgi:hypothetical protein